MLTVIALLVVLSWTDGNQYYLEFYDKRLEAREGLLSANNAELLEYVRTSDVVRRDLLERLFVVDYIDKHTPTIVVRKLSLFRDAPMAAPSHVVGADFGELVRLVGYDVAEDVVAGSLLDVTLYWKRLEDLDHQYLVFTHLIDEEWRMWGQKDGIPRVGFNVSDEWGDGRMLEDERSILVPDDAPDGVYKVEIGVYDPVAVERLRRDEVSKGELDDRVLTIPIRVLADD